jgi:hypothetical protein
MSAEEMLVKKDEISLSSLDARITILEARVLETRTDRFFRFIKTHRSDIAALIALFASIVAFGKIVFSIP